MQEKPKKLWFPLGDNVWECREPEPGERGGKPKPDRTWKRLIMRDGNQRTPERQAGRVPVFGSGDKTTAVYEDGKPYRFREGSKKGQMAELKRKVEENVVKKNKAPWSVEGNVHY